MPTQYEEMKAMFTKFGIPFTEGQVPVCEVVDRNKGETVKRQRKSLTLDQGIGYTGFECTFHFDTETEEFKEYGVWE